MQYVCRYLVLSCFYLSLAACLPVEIPATTNQTIPSDNTDEAPPSNETSCEIPNTDSFQDGDGSAAQPYIICSVAQFLLINESSSNLASHYELATNLDFTGFPFEPVGFYDNSDASSRVAFSGSFDGGNFVISGLDYEASNVDYAAGLFAHSEGAVFENINIQNSVIYSNRRGALLVGFAINSDFRNIALDGRVENTTLSTSGVDLAGLAGWLEYNDDSKAYVIDSINSNVDILGNDLLGSLLGFVDLAADNLDVTMANILTTGDVSQSAGGNSIGGAFGLFRANNYSNLSLTLQNIRSTSDVLIDQGTGGSWSGAFIGQFQMGGSADSNTLVFDNILVEGNIDTIANFNIRGTIGGLIGNGAMSASNSTMTFSNIGVQSNLRALASAAASNNNFGGLFGYLVIGNASGASTFNLTNSYYVGEISSQNSVAMNQVGGLIGRMDANSTTGAGNIFNFDTVYVDISENVPNLGSHHFALVGRYLNSPTVNFTDAYANGPTTLVFGSQVDPHNSAGTNVLNDTEIFQEASFLGTGWDFTTIWNINEGVASPRLRSHQSL